MLGFVSFNDEPQQYLLTAVLRPGNAPASLGAAGILWRIVQRIRRLFPGAKIRIRLDGCFAHPDLLELFDTAPDVEYVVAMASNAVLKRRAQRAMRQARRLSRRTGKTEHVYAETRYAARTWPRRRRVILKAEVVREPGKDPKDNPRFLVTNLTQSPRWIYEGVYCQRGVVRVITLAHERVVWDGTHWGRLAPVVVWANRSMPDPLSPSPRRSIAGLRSLRSLRPALLLEKEPPQFSRPSPPEHTQPPQGDTICLENFVLYRSDRFESDVVTKALQAFDVVTSETLRLEPVQEVTTQVDIASVVFQKMINNHQDRLTDGDQGSLLPAAGGQAPVLSSEGAVSGVTRRPRGLHQGLAQPATDRRRPTGAAFPGTLFVSRTHPGPRGQLRRRGEGLHVASHLGEHDFGHPALDSRHLHQSFFLRLQRAGYLGDPGVHFGQQVLHTPQFLPQQLQHKTMMLGEPTFERFFQSRDLATQLPLRQVRQPFGILPPSDQRLDHGSTRDPPIRGWLPTPT